MAEEETEFLLEYVVKELIARGKKLAAAESCTAGIVADLLASVPGASSVFWGSFVTYTQDAKVKLLGVTGETLKNYGAVSQETACAMAKGALEKSGADYAVSVTGLAGPDGDGSAVPVGTVWIGLARQGGKAGSEACAFLFQFEGSRNELRHLAARKSLEELLRYIDTETN